MLALLSLYFKINVTFIVANQHEMHRVSFTLQLTHQIACRGTFEGTSFGELDPIWFLNGLNFMKLLFCVLTLLRKVISSHHLGP